ncbi:MAG: phosphoribosylaminoimidazolesuccinocarboxamide synthase [Alphaproteobacteria bacterium]
MAELIHKGSVKDVYRVGPGEIEFRFSDRISVFDMPIPSAIPGKGAALCSMACHWFSRLDAAGIPHHFLERTGPAAMRVRAVDQVPSLANRPKPWRSVFIPLECIQRHYVAGSLLDRLRKANLSPEAVGLAPGTVPAMGMKLPSPFFEMSTKFEASDRLLSHEEAMALAGIDPHTVEALETLCRRIDGLIADALARASFFHVDGKKEFGFDADGRLMVVDVFGTLDEDRFWDRAAYEGTGATIDLSKEYVRQHYRAIGYKDALDAARASGQPDPAIPPLPQDIIEETAALYGRVVSEIVGPVA